MSRSPNLLGLAVLGLLHERPMHPHGISTELRERGMDRSFKLTTGSLYDVVRVLERNGWIAAVETAQVGSRPPRTIYAPTDEGRTEFTQWIDELVRQPANEYPRFLSAVTYLGALGPDGAIDAMSERAARIRSSVGTLQFELEQALQTLEAEGKPRLFVLEAEYAIWMAQAELNWVEKTINEIQRGTLRWPDESDGHE